MLREFGTNTCTKSVQESCSKWKKKNDIKWKHQELECTRNDRYVKLMDSLKQTNSKFGVIECKKEKHVWEYRH